MHLTNQKGDEHSWGLEMSSWGRKDAEQAPSIHAAAAGPILPSLTYCFLVLSRTSSGALLCLELRGRYSVRIMKVYQKSSPEKSYSETFMD